jgi:hypothetical protein
MTKDDLADLRAWLGRVGTEAGRWADRLDPTRAGKPKRYRELLGPVEAVMNSSTRAFHVARVYLGET